MIKPGIFSLLLLVLASLIVAAADVPPPANILERRIASAEFKQIPLEDVLQFFRDVTGANIVLRENTIKAAKIDLQDVTATLKDMKMSDALKLVLTQAGKGKLDYAMSDNVITISTTNAIKIAATRPAHPAATQPMRHTQKDVVAKMNTSMHAMKFEQMPLADAIEFLGEASKIDIIVDWADVRYTGIVPAAPISANLKDVKWSTLIGIVLDAAGDGKLDWRMDGDSLVIFGAPGAKGTKVSTLPEANPSELDKPVQAALDKVLPVKFEKLPWDDAIQFLRETTGQKFLIRRPVLKDAGIDEKAEVKLEQSKDKFSKDLELLLNQAGKGKLAYAISDGIIVISTIENLERDFPEANVVR